MAEIKNDVVNDEKGEVKESRNITFRGCLPTTSWFVGGSLKVEDQRSSNGCILLPFVSLTFEYY
jgi:hypothetical protein